MTGDGDDSVPAFSEPENNAIPREINAQANQPPLGTIILLHATSLKES